MAYEIEGIDISVPAGSDLSASQYCAVVVNSSTQLALPAGATVITLGVLQNKPNATGHAGAVRVSGVTKMVAGGTINVGDAIGVDSSGNANHDTTSTHYIIGIALTAGAATNLVTVLLLPQGKN